MATIDDDGWLLTNGGPFAIMPMAKRNSWGGDSFSSATSSFPPVDNDYTRACRFGAIEGVISDDDGEAVVIFSSGLCGTAAVLNGIPTLVFYEVAGEDFVVKENELMSVEFLRNSKQLILKIDFRSDYICIIDSSDVGSESLSKCISVSPGWKDMYRHYSKGYVAGKYCGDFIIYELLDMV